MDAPLQPRLGYPRTWTWWGWSIRYRFLPARQPNARSLPLILIHGFGASSEHWRHNLQLWSEQHPVFALDLLGFGASTKAAAPYRPGLWATCIYDFWQQFIDTPSILIGNSLGSVTSMVAAHVYPEMTQGLVCFNLPDASVLTPAISTPKLLRGRVKGISNTLKTFLLNSATWPWLITPLLRIARSPRTLRDSLKFAYYDHQYVDDELYELVREPAHDAQATQALRFLTRWTPTNPERHTARYILPRLQIPILLMWGKQDRLVPASLGPRCAALNSLIQLIELDHAGHCPQDECSDRVNDLLVDWLQREFPDSHPTPTTAQ